MIRNQNPSQSCDLCNICLEMIIRAANIDPTGTIYYKALQILGCVHDLDIITRDIRSLDTAVDNIVDAADDIKYLQDQIYVLKKE